MCDCIGFLLRGNIGYFYTLLSYSVLPNHGVISDWYVDSEINERVDAYKIIPYFHKETWNPILPSQNYLSYRRILMSDLTHIPTNRSPDSFTDYTP